MSILTEARIFTLHDESQTSALGKALGKALGNALDKSQGLAMGSCLDVPPAIIFLSGELGAGKTTLVRGLLRGLGHQGKVVSPTYTLMEPYEVAGMHFLHIDLYRIADPAELEFLGIRERMNDAILMVEWPERGAGWLPRPDLQVALTTRGTGREAKIEAMSERGTGIAGQIQLNPED